MADAARGGPAVGGVAHMGRLRIPTRSVRAALRVAVRVMAAPFAGSAGRIARPDTSMGATAPLPGRRARRLDLRND